MHGNKCRIGLIALGLSLIALLLAVFPACFIQQKKLNIEPICHDERAAFSFDMENCSERHICLTEAEQCAADLRYLDRHLRLYNIFMLLAAVAAISAAFYSWRKTISYQRSDQYIQSLPRPDHYECQS